MGRTTLLILLFSTYLFSQNGFILHNDNILLEKAATKIEKMCSELKERTGTGVYVSAISDLEGASIGEYAEKIASGLQGSYALIVLSSGDQQIEMVMSEDLQEILDRDEILDEYIIPLLVEKRKDLGYRQQYSAGIFNGVAEVTDEVASRHGIILANSVGSESKDFYEGLMFVIKLMLLLTLIAMVYAYMKSKQERRDGE